ncbi:siaz-interacting nuclear protein [Puntigrus tetrazona]|uniref:siaz-interacting nuclear protein n=1 Tax=Puntigrus tetrazona TaxID=1606681 RepID=UPI001C8A0745|nr:siaz-interacting nuclear protein [Puntigrus tetrazona]
MAQHNDVQTDAAQSYPGKETDKSYVSVFKRKQPLTFSPNRQYALAVVSPLQKQDSWETVLADDRASPPVHTNNRRYTIYDYSPEYSSTVTTFQPFSFDERDAARRVEHERRLQEMRRMQERQWRSTFRAHPIRRYKPLIQLCGQTHSHQSK